MRTLFLLFIWATTFVGCRRVNTENQQEEDSPCYSKIVSLDTLRFNKNDKQAFVYGRFGSNCGGYQDFFSAVPAKPDTIVIHDTIRTVEFSPSLSGWEIDTLKLQQEYLLGGQPIQGKKHWVIEYSKGNTIFYRHVDYQTKEDL